MKKQKLIYQYFRYDGKPLHAKREVSYELKLSSRMLLDELCFKWNKERIESAINSSLDSGNKEKFLKLSEEYRHYIWE